MLPLLHLLVFFFSPESEVCSTLQSVQLFYSNISSNNTRLDTSSVLLMQVKLQKKTTVWVVLNIRFYIRKKDFLLLLSVQLLHRINRTPGQEQDSFTVNNPR